MLDSKEKERERRVLIHPIILSEGIETNLNLDRCPLPPAWHRVVPDTGALATSLFTTRSQSQSSRMM